MKNLSKYPPQLFHSLLLQDAIKIAKSVKFASLYLPHQPQSDVIFSPLFYQQKSQNSNHFNGHLFKYNPIIELLQNKSQIPVKLVFNAANVYISPQIYDQKQKTHQVVPTWNYVAAQFNGKLKLVPDDQLLPLLQKQSQIFQQAVGSAWRLSQAPTDYIEKLKKSIRGISIEVNSWKSHFKLHQNRQNELQNVKRWSKQQQTKRKTIVDWMQQFK